MWNLHVILPFFFFFLAYNGVENTTQRRNKRKNYITPKETLATLSLRMSSRQKRGSMILCTPKQETEQDEKGKTN